MHRRLEPPQSISAYRNLIRDAVNSIDTEILLAAAHRLMLTRQTGNTVWVLGNGGSQANAAHLVLHLREDGIKAIDMQGDNAWLTASANDYSYGDSPARLVALHGNSNDILLVFSGSGSSSNVVNAMKAANDKGIDTIAILGGDGGEALALANLSILIKSNLYGPVEDAHSVVVHLLQGLTEGWLV